MNPHSIIFSCTQITTEGYRNIAEGCSNVQCIFLNELGPALDDDCIEVGCWLSHLLSWGEGAVITIWASDSAHYTHTDLSRITTERWELHFSLADGAIILHMIQKHNFFGVIFFPGLTAGAM